MSQSLNVAKKHIVEYAYCGWFYGNEGHIHLHNVLDELNINYTSESDFPEFEKEFEISRKDLKIGLEKLRGIEKNQEVDDVDPESLEETLEESDITLPSLIDCFEWMLNNSDKENEKEWIYVSFF
jgi:hypothetical protein